MILLWALKICRALGLSSPPTMQLHGLLDLNSLRIHESDAKERPFRPP